MDLLSGFCNPARPEGFEGSRHEEEGFGHGCWLGGFCLAHARPPSQRHPTYMHACGLKQQCWLHVVNAVPLLVGGRRSGSLLLCVFSVPSVSGPAALRTACVCADQAAAVLGLWPRTEVHRCSSGFGGYPHTPSRGGAVFVVSRCTAAYGVSCWCGQTKALCACLLGRQAAKCTNKDHATNAEVDIQQGVPWPAEDRQGRVTD